MDGSTPLYRIVRDATGVSTDTRTLRPGQVFFALSGPSFDGNRFVEQALDTGAVHAVASDPSLAGDERITVVDDVLASLQAVASEHRATLTLPIIGITGSNGKTTTKELIHSVLSQRFRTYATRGNLNNHIGVPLSLLEVSADDHDIAIIEMGASAVGEIASYCRWARPTHGLITNIGKAHIEGFGGVEGIIRGKTELYAALAERRGTVFVRHDDDLLMDKAQVVGSRFTFGTHSAADLTADCLEVNPFVVLRLGDEVIETQLIGRYNVGNALAAAAFGRFFGLTDAEITAGLEAYVPENNRSQTIEVGDHLIILDAYNANPTSMEAGLDHLASIDRAARWAVLGDMFELGETEDDEHAAICRLVDEAPDTTGLFCGERFARHAHAFPAHHFVSSTAEAAEWMARQEAPEPSAVLIKGSRSMRMEDVLPAVKDWLGRPRTDD